VRVRVHEWSLKDAEGAALLGNICAQACVQSPWRSTSKALTSTTLRHACRCVDVCVRANTCAPVFMLVYKYEVRRGQTCVEKHMLTC